MKRTIWAALAAGTVVFMTMLSVPGIQASKPLLCSMEADLVMEPMGWVD